MSRHHLANPFPNSRKLLDPLNDHPNRSHICAVETTDKRIQSREHAFEFLGARLSEILDRNVDLNTPGFLSRHIRAKVMAEAQVQYAAR